METQYKEIGVLVGQTVARIDRPADEVVFTLINGEQYKLFHQQDCCEQVCLEDVAGDLQDLVGSPITMAEEIAGESPANYFDGGYEPESYTWTFYKLATIKGYVTLRWLGESNGYYSESVDFIKIV